MVLKAGSFDFGDDDGDSAAQGDAEKDALAAEISKTELGRFLLDDLKRCNIELVITDDMSAAGQDMEGSAGGYWDPEKRRIALRSGLPLAKALQYFAHETRHSAQFDADKVLPCMEEVLHPQNFLLRTRLREMDADAFAVYFLADHAMQAGSRHFFELRDSETGDDFSGGPIDRSAMFDAFYDKWRDTKQDGALSMKAAAFALFRDPRVNESYDERCAHLWQDVIWPKVAATASEPEGETAQALRTLFRKFRDRKFQSPEETLLAHAKIYSKLYAEAGCPDYLEGSYGKLFSFLADDAPGAADIWSGRMPGLKEKFNQTADRFLTEVPDLSGPPPPKPGPEKPASP